MVPRLRSRFRGLREIVSSLGGGSTILFGGLMLANAIAYVYHMLLARMMSPADYGTVVTLTSVTYVLAVFVRTLQAWVIRAVSAMGDAGAGRLRALFVIGMRRLAPLGVVALAGHWLFSHWVADFLHLQSATPVVVLGLYTATSLLLPLPRGILIGLNRLRLASLVSVLDPVARLMAGAALVVWGLEVNGALTGYAIGHVLAFAAALVPLWPLLRGRGEHTHLAERPGGLDRYGVLTLAINTSLMIIATVDQIAVKHFFSAEIAGNYGVAWLLGRVIAMTAISLGWALFARSATTPSTGAERTRLLATALLAIGAIAVTLTAGFLAAPVLMVRLMGGSQYLVADAFVGLVGIEMTLFALVYVQAYYHISTGRTQVVWPLCLALAVEIALLVQYHDSVQQILVTLIYVMSGLLICVSALSWRVLAQERARISRPT